MNDIVEAIIEIPMGTKNKFEVNKETGKIKLDRVLYSSLTYPGEYGYIDNTLSDFVVVLYTFTIPFSK